MVELIHRTSSEGTRNSRVNKNENQTGLSIERPNQIYEATHGHASWVVVLSQHSYKVTPPPLYQVINCYVLLTLLNVKRDKTHSRFAIKVQNKFPFADWEFHLDLYNYVQDPCTFINFLSSFIILTVCFQFIFCGTISHNNGKTFYI